MNQLFVSVVKPRLLTGEERLTKPHQTSGVFCCPNNLHQIAMVPDCNATRLINIPWRASIGTARPA